MHVAGGSIAKDFFEESVHFQTETVLTIYTVIFTVLAVICIVQYHLARMKSKVTGVKQLERSRSQERV